MRYPGEDDGKNGEIVYYQYHPQLALDQVVSNYPDVYVRSATYDSAGRVTVRMLGGYLVGDEVKMQYTYYPWTEQGGRLEGLKSGTPADPESLQKLYYTYDSVGNVLTILDYKMGTDTQTPQT